jgi:hypothetical protein
MNNIDKNIIKIFYDFLEEEDHDSFRQCSHYWSKIIGKNYFENIKIDVKKIINNHCFRYFVHKYKLIINVSNVATNSQMAYLNTYKIKSINFHNKLNKQIDKYNFPSSLHTLKFGNDFNQPLYKNSLPESLTSLEFGDDYNKLIIEDVLPILLINLKFGICFNKPIFKNVLPSLLQSLEFGDYFNCSMEENALSKSLTSLKFGLDFNQQIEENVLPESLTSLKFGCDFNELLKENALPKYLISLKFGYHYNQPIEKNVLPKSLIILEFGHDFNQPIDQNILPPLLDILKLGNNFCQYISPNLLTSIKIYNYVSIGKKKKIKQIKKILKNGSFSESLFFKQIKQIGCVELIDHYIALKNMTEYGSEIDVYTMSGNKIFNIFINYEPNIYNKEKYFISVCEYTEVWNNVLPQMDSNGVPIKFGLREHILSNRSEYFINGKYIGNYLLKMDNGGWYVAEEEFVKMFKKINKCIMINKIYPDIYEFIKMENKMIKFINVKDFKFNSNLFSFALKK